MTSAPILAMSNLVGDFIVYIDSSLEGVGSVLMQDGQVNSYESRKVKDHELNYPTHHLELIVMVYALLH